METPHTFNLTTPWRFFAITFGISWLFLGLAALSGQAEPAPFPMVLHYLGGMTPFITALVLTGLAENRETWRDYWQRAFDLKRIGPAWLAVIILIVPVLTGASGLLDRLLGGQGLQLEAAARFVEQPLAIIPFALFMLLFGPVPEELAWRGYALDRMQIKWNALAASLVLGVIWTLWHLPFFFIKGSYQHGLGVGTLSFWLFMLDKVPQTILMTWIYNNTRRSTLSAILFHFMVNFVGELFALPGYAEVYYIAFWIVAAIAVVLVWGPETLTRSHDKTGSTP